MRANVSLLLGLIPLLVPILIYLTRIYLPRVPKNLYPMLAPCLGVVLELAMYQGGLVEQKNPLVGAALGGLGTWLREVVDQLKRPMAPPT